VNTETINAPQPESNENLKVETDRILCDHQALHWSQKQAWNLYGLRSGGAAELIKAVGAKRFCEALNRTLELKSKRAISMYDVLREIEPNASQRRNIYKQIVEMVDADPRYHKKNAIGCVEIGGNIPLSVHMSVEGWRNIDASAKLPVIGGLMERLRYSGDQIQYSSERLLDLAPLDEGMNSEIEAIHDLHTWHESKQKEFRSSRNRLYQRAAEIIEEIQNAITERSHEVEVNYRQERENLESDDQQLKGIEMRSQQGQAAVSNAVASLAKSKQVFEECFRRDEERAIEPYRSMLDKLSPYINK